jgi:hypothetical protein
VRPTIPLKLSAIAFTLLWFGWMLWWSGEYDPGNVIILAVCSAVVGYIWYRVMGWWFRRISLLPHDGSGPGANR